MALVSAIKPQKSAFGWRGPKITTSKVILYASSWLSTELSLPLDGKLPEEKYCLLLVVLHIEGWSRFAE